MADTTLLCVRACVRACMPCSFTVAISEIRELLIGKDKVPNAVRTQQVSMVHGIYNIHMDNFIVNQHDVNGAAVNLYFLRPGKMFAYRFRLFATS